MTQPATCARCEHSEIGHKGGPCGCYTPMPEDHTAFLKCGCTGFVAKVALAVADPAVEIVAPLIHGSSLSDGGRSRVVVDVPGEAATAAAMMAVLVCRACGFAFREHGPKIEPTTRLPFCPPAFGAACVFAMPLTVTPDVVVTDEVTTPGELAGLHLTAKGAELVAKALPIDTVGEVAAPALPPAPLSSVDGMQACLACAHEKHAHSLETGPVRRGACSVKGCVCKGFDDPPRERFCSLCLRGIPSRDMRQGPTGAWSCTDEAACASRIVDTQVAADALAAGEPPEPPREPPAIMSNPPPPLPPKARKPRAKKAPPTLPLPAGVDLATFARAFNALDITPNADGTITVKGQTVSGAPIDRTIDVAHAFESAAERVPAVSEAPTVAASDTAYEAFLATKLLAAQAHGFEPGPMNPSLFPWQKAIVEWALRLGRCAIFADCGLGKGPMGLEWARQVVAHTGGSVIYLAPLAVAQQLHREAVKFGIPARIAEKQSDVTEPGIWITNYEKIHLFDTRAFVGVVADESSCLKCYSGKLKKALVEGFSRTPYRLACTATPAPNDPMELGNHCEFLGVMTSHKMLARWFINDTTQAGVWRLKGHAAADYWAWVTTWAVCCSLPSDIGGDDTGYILPPLSIHQHTVDVDIVEGREDEGKDLKLFRDPSLSATTLHKELRRTANARAKAVAELVLNTPGQWMVWCHTNYESDELQALMPEAVDIRGDDTLAQKEAGVADFLAGKTRILISKGSILGFGLNLQNCHQQAYVGLSYSFETFYQCIRRSYRFGQKNPVDAHIFAASTEGAIADTVKRKQADHDRMKGAMVAAMRGSGLRVGRGLETALDYETRTASGKGWEVRLGDCVDLVRRVPSETAGLVLYSPPFSNLYTYSDSYRDMGNSEDDAEFFRHYGFLLGELLRVTKTGRLMAVHVKQCVNYIGRDGASGLRDFRGDVIRACQTAGWVFHSEVTIWKCPVTEMQRTKSHGLLYKQLRANSTFSRQGLAEYLLVFRKWPVGETSPEEVPVTKTEEDFPLDLWQRYASPVWMDIDQTDVLNAKSARDGSDERHICPLQLGVIERAVKLWTNKGDLVLSPFSGIGSEGVGSLREGREYLGFELKESYFKQSAKFLREVEDGGRQASLFSPEALGEDSA